MRKKIIVLTGAGISAESGISTFRDAGGLWEGHDIMEVASPQGWAKNKSLVLDFYNKRRKQLHQVKPNAAHKLLAELEKEHDVIIITQNVDDLHERAGSTQVVHLHGELKKVRSTVDKNDVFELEGWELKLGDKCKKGSQLRPHIVWFGEAVPMMETAMQITQTAEILVIIGTSLQVYPAASLLNFAPPFAPIFLIDPNAEEIASTRKITAIQEKATVGVKLWIDEHLHSI